VSTSNNARGLPKGVSVYLPRTEPCGVSQGNEERCFVTRGMDKMEIGFHEYDKIYSIPGLYEHLFYEKMRCCSPGTVCGLLVQEIRKTRESVSDLRVLDMGAGNGMVAEELTKFGVNTIIGIDIIEEASMAAQRDRPDVYQDYFVADMTEPPDTLNHALREEQLDCLVTVAALGFGDIPPLAFAEAFNLIATPGWVAFNIKDNFLSDSDASGFASLTRDLVDRGLIRILVSSKYRHRFCLDGRPLYYRAVVAEKCNSISDEWLEQMRAAEACQPA